MKFMLCVVGLFISLYASAAEPLPLGSEESKIAIGDSRAKVEALLGEIESMEPADRMRTRLVFKRCTILFQSGKVVELPVMRTDAELSKRREEQEMLTKERLAASQPGSPQEIALKKAKMNAIRSRIASITSRFEIISSPGSPTLYVHKAFPSGKYASGKYGLSPSVLVDDQGAAAIMTNYYGGAWLFHDSIGIRIGDKNYSSSILPREKPQRRVANAGFIEERCLFDSSADQELVREISNSRGKKVFLSLQRHGGSILGVLTDQQFASFPPIVELTPAEITAFRESVELADAFAALAGSR